MFGTFFMYMYIVATIMNTNDKMECMYCMYFCCFILDCLFVEVGKKALMVTMPTMGVSLTHLVLVSSLVQCSLPGMSLGVVSIWLIAQFSLLEME